MKVVFLFMIMFAFAGSIFSQQIAQPNQIKYPADFFDTVFPSMVAPVPTAEKREAGMTIHTSIAVNNRAMPGIPGVSLPALDKRNRIALFVKKEKALLPEKRTLAEKSFPALSLKFSISD